MPVSTVSLILALLVAAPPGETVLPAAPPAVNPPVAANLEELNLSITYDGTDLNVFGYLPESADGVVLTLESLENPPLEVVRKEKVVLFWLARKKFRVEHIPALHMVATTPGAADAVTAAGDTPPSFSEAALEERMEYEILSGREDSSDASVLFRGIVKLKEKLGLFRREAGAVKLGESRLFHHIFRLPDRVAPGEYILTAHATGGGRVIGSSEAGFTAERTGIVAWLSNLAAHNAVAYGVIAVVVALFAGIGVSLIFRGGGGH